MQHTINVQCRKLIRSISSLAILTAGVTACNAPPTPLPTMQPTPIPTMIAAATFEAPILATSEPTLLAEPTAEPTDIPIVVEPALPPGVEYDPDMLEVIARINEWRLSVGLWPLRLNADLQTLAEGQANYIASLPDFPDDPHVDASGTYPKQRAINAGWPYYNNPQQIAVDEIAYVGANVNSAITWWQGSELHTKTATGDGYREIGAALADYQGYQLYIVVFGSRPGILPALVDPIGQALYLTSERYRYASGGTWIQDVSQVQVNPADVTASEWMSWQLALPYAFDSRVFPVFYTDGAATAKTDVDPNLDIAWLVPNLKLNPASPLWAAEHQAPE
jgi:uncharacterized protein YkwD